MENNIKESLQQVYDLFKETRTKSAEFLASPEHILLREKLDKNLETQIKFLGFQLGIDDGVDDFIANPKRVTSFLGHSLENTPVVELPSPEAGAKKEDAKELAKQNEANELIEKLPALIELMLKEEADIILDTMSDLEIRAVGKKAGLPVTETSPEKVDAHFIGQIKDAFAKQAEIANAGTNADILTPEAGAKKEDAKAPVANPKENQKGTGKNAANSK